MVTDVIFDRIEGGGFASVFYLCEELFRRGSKVSLISLTKNPEKSSIEGLPFVYKRKFTSASIIDFYYFVQIIAFCRKFGISCVLADDWGFFRHHPFSRSVLQSLIKFVGLKFVALERDPYVDYQIANKRLRGEGWKHGILAAVYSRYYRNCDLIILPSNAYVRSFLESGLSKNKLMGAFKGIDTKSFKPSTGSKLKQKLGLFNKFVIGWFGHMNRYRRIHEILIPLIKEIGVYIPNSHVLIAGSGELQEDLKKFRQENPDLNLTLFDFISYLELPEYLEVCDVLLAPLSTEYNFTQCAASLKIVEALAVGRPVIATRTKISQTDFKDLRGVVWVDDNLTSFLNALIEIHCNYQVYLGVAREQAFDIGKYSTRISQPLIAERIESLFKK